MRAYDQAGPPFQADDATPVDLGHYEAYVFGTLDGTRAQLDTMSPRSEFNWGSLPTIQLHAILLLIAAISFNKPVCAPGGEGPIAFGAEDMELEVKYGFIKQMKCGLRLARFRCSRS